MFGRRDAAVESPEEVEQVVVRRRFLQGAILMSGLAQAPFKEPKWPYVFEDIRDEMRSAQVKHRPSSAQDLANVLDALPSKAIRRLYSAFMAYQTPLEPEMEASVDELLSVFDAPGAARMRQRREAVQALEAAAEREKAQRIAELERIEALRFEHLNCPRGRMDMSPEEFLIWIQGQTPDTWHVVVCGWQYDDGAYHAALSWILDQPECDAATAARFFFIAALGVATEEPENLRPHDREQWSLMKKAADRWSSGHYRQAEFDPEIDEPDIAWFDKYAARRSAEGRPLPFAIPAPPSRDFAKRPALSEFAYFGGGRAGPSFDVWLNSRGRPDSCGKDFPACCGP